MAQNVAARRHRSWSTLAQVMACCLTAPSHYLNQRWLIISEVLWYWPVAISHEILKISVIDISLKMSSSRLQPHFPGVNELIKTLWYVQSGQNFQQHSLDSKCAEFFVGYFYCSNRLGEKMINYIYIYIYIAKNMAYHLNCRHWGC